MSKLLRDAGEALYGPQWQSAISRDLGVSDRTIRRWASGTTDLPSGVVMNILGLSENRAANLDAVIERLKIASRPAS